MYREWYGATGPDVGLRLQAEQIAAGVKEREAGEKMALAVADPSIWAEAGASHGVPGPSIGEKMARAGVVWQPADNRRKQGWDQVRGRLLGDVDGNPMLVVFDTCTEFIRTFPVLQHDELRPEDLDTTSEDHEADCTRYLCMARPWARPTPQPAKPLIDTRLPTMAEVIRQTERRRSMGRRI